MFRNLGRNLGQALFSGGAVLLALSLGLVGCGDSGDATALRLRLVTDPVLNTEAQLVAQLDTVELVFAAAGGFANVPVGSARVGVLWVKDTNGDGLAELVWSRSLAGASTLPPLRLVPGQNAGKVLAISAFGQASGVVVATGAVSGIGFSRGKERNVDIPFNLSAGFRPPRVVLSSPHDGQTVPAALSQVTLEFSRKIKPLPASGLKLLYESGANAPVSGGWTLGTATVQEAGGPHTRSTATLKVLCQLNPGTYRLEAATTITDEQGQHLDQHAANGGNDPFVARFQIPGTKPAGNDPCTTIVSGCKTDNDCQPKAQFFCAKKQNLSEGKCLPRKTSCDAIKCEQGSVCTVTAKLAECIADCRLYGCPNADKEICGAKSGVCEPCTPCTSPPPVGCKEQCQQVCTQEPSQCDICIKNCQSG